MLRGRHTHPRVRRRLPSAYVVTDSTPDTRVASEPAARTRLHLSRERCDSSASPSRAADAQRSDHLRLRKSSTVSAVLRQYPILAGQAVVMSVYIDAKVNISKPLVNRGAITEFSKARIRSFKS